ncbi:MULTISPECIES: multidrug effflux MFS transporter [Kosakonia]|uniref:Bcr/CflA family efflux transporter n=1 Tax=Kosakonia radicincitans TaxID=283686 RepID=A0AAX2ESJ2_9ENTR|nr:MULTISPECIES: multidrug effflux MFS transporter [Kosakonia]MDP9566462.1 DHA1 family bicyclomycin/chloramphenicol resistance-like MFS transporter [Kosakonia oryzae]APG16381.1 Bcr/CflA family drug resistance efflux transporter [Kosakonia radicincitans]PTA90222.1 MFS transporter [Kosakonia sp. H7A]SET46786.1 MFS transporter, DHA1 family, bicyclomycin/chloramphenicol resistance protein [Kosakonia radicincitans]SFE54479.1 MFS transporter, DHA1 family, bicyclomycin/chloramphenicol resistance prot
MPRISLAWAIVLGMLTAIGPICTDLYLPALPDITRQLSATTTLTQLSLTASLLGLGLGQLFFGPLSDRLGRKRPLMLSLLLFILSSVLCATTQDIHWLIFWRFIQGLAGAGGSVLSRAIARDKYHGTLLTQFFALLMTVNGIAPIVSPVLGGYIASTLHWRALFWTMAAVGVVLLLSSMVVLKETLSEKSSGGGLLKTSLIVLKNKQFSTFCFIQAFMLAGLFSYIGSSSFVLQSEYGLTAMQFSLLFAVNGGGLIISALIFARLARFIDGQKLLTRGLFLAVCSAVLTALFAGFGMPVLALVGLFFTVALNSGVSTIAGSAAMNSVEARHSGTASALLGMLMFVFGGIATPLSGIGGEAMWKMSFAIVLAYSAALVIHVCGRIKTQH